MTEREVGDPHDLEELERALLVAARSGAPREGRERAFAVASGLLAGSAANAGAAAGGAGKAASVLTAKWVSIVGIGAIAATGATFVARSRIDVPAPQSAAAPSAPSALSPSPVRAPAVRRDPEPSPSAPAEPAPAETASASAIAPAAVAVTSLPRPTVSSTGSLAEELGTLERARAFLAAEQPAMALQVLDAYARQFPHGAMGSEADVLRVEALFKAGDRPAAERAAGGFLRDHPGSPYASRVRSLLGANP